MPLCQAAQIGGALPHRAVEHRKIAVQTLHPLGDPVIENKGNADGFDLCHARSCCRTRII